ncbi:replication factor C small subunit [Candidatus Micrarchaeota archaeon]|nr:replication factor C small subunit [Candidatus Micrarchaeota archaeon]
MTEPQTDYIPWVEKYRPQMLADVVGQETAVQRLKAYVKQKNVPHLLFAGPAGTGKTTCALALARELYGDDFRGSFLELNASDERGIDVVRGKIKDFARTLALQDVPFKLIFLDEADALTQDAQQALRRTMEQYSKSCRFILNANYSSRIIEPIQSRCAVFRFMPLTAQQSASLAEKVAAAEHVKLEKGAPEAIASVAQGDARRVLNVLQAAAAMGKSVSEDDILKVSAMARPKEVAEMVQMAWKGRFSESRALLDQLIIQYGLSGEDIIKQTYREIVSLDVPDSIKVHLVDRVGEYSFRLSEGADERIQLEALLAQLVLAGQKKA